MTWLPPAVAAALALIAGIAAHHWLGLRRYRYADEADLPPRNTVWVIVVLPLVCGLGVLSWWDDAKLAVSLGFVLGQLSWAHLFVGTTVAYLSALPWACSSSPSVARVAEP